MLHKWLITVAAATVRNYSNNCYYNKGIILQANKLYTTKKCASFKILLIKKVHIFHPSILNVNDQISCNICI